MRLKSFIIFAALACCVFAQLNGPTPAPSEQSQLKKDNTPKEKSAADLKGSPLPAAISPPSTPSKKQSGANDKKTSSTTWSFCNPSNWDSNWVVAIFTVAIAGAAIAQVGIYHRQCTLMEEGLAETKKSADAALKASVTSENALKIGERAYILYKVVKNPNLISADVPFEAEMIWQNFGKTPATHCHVIARFAVLDNAPSDFDEIERHLDTLPATATIAPNESSPITVFPITKITKNDLADIASGRKKLFCYGVFLYRDIFSDRHSTHLSLVYHPEARRFAYSPTGNKTT
jgi:hypothetical protein